MLGLVIRGAEVLGGMADTLCPRQERLCNRNVANSVSVFYSVQTAFVVDEPIHNFDLGYSCHVENHYDCSP